MSQRTLSLAGTTVSSGVGKLLSSRSLQLLNKLLSGVQNGGQLADRQVTNVAKKTGMSEDEVRAWVQIRIPSDNDPLKSIQEDFTGPLPLNSGNLGRLSAHTQEQDPPADSQIPYLNTLATTQEETRPPYQWDRLEDMPGPLWDLMIKKLYKGTSCPKSKGKRAIKFQPDLSTSRKEQLEMWERKVQELATEVAKKRKRVEAAHFDSEFRSKRIERVAKSLELPPGWKL